jgi:hypothetical protein
MQTQRTRQDAAVRQATRARVVERLMQRGLALVEAEGWCDAWERYAAAEGVLSSRDFFWDAGKGWIDAQRTFRGRS